MADEPLINEIVLDDFRQTFNKNKEKKKHFIIPFLPRMYWLFYRRPLYFLVFIPSLTEGWSNMASTVCMGNILDAIHKENGLEIIKKNAFFAFIAALVCGIFAFFNYYVWIIIGDKIGIKMKRILFKSLMEKDVEFFDTHPIGDLLNLLQDDTRMVSNAFTELKTHQVSAIGKLFAALFVMYGINYKLATFSFIAAIIITMIVKLFKSFAFKHFRRMFECNGKLLTVADETITNIKVVSSFNRQKEQIELIKGFQNEACHSQTIAFLLMHLSFSLGNLIINGANCIILNYGAYFILKSKLTAGALLSLTRASFWTGMEFNHIFDTMTHEQRAIEASNRIFAIVDSPVDVVDGTNSIAPDHFEGRVEFENVWFKYPTRNSWILKNVSFVIEPSEISAIVGHSGSGKSTIVQLLLRFYDVDQGRILLDGVDIKDYNLRFLRQAIGVVQQDPHLFTISIKENIQYGKIGASDSEVHHAAEIANAAKFIEKLPGKYDTMVGEKGTLLSGGQKQRIAIARAVIKDPKLLVTDEATSALDAESERKVQSALDKIMEGRTSIIIAHRLGTIRAAKKIFVFDQGVLAESGTHEELLDKRGAYYNLVQRQLAKKLEKQ